MATRLRKKRRKYFCDFILLFYICEYIFTGVVAAPVKDAAVWKEGKERLSLPKQGIKEHIIVDTLGLPMAAKVHAANIHDSVGAIEPIKKLRYIFPGFKKIIADGGYRGKLADTVKDFGWKLSVVLRPDESSKMFQVLPLRWIVERTFSWIENYRRLTTDYELLLSDKTQ